MAADTQAPQPGSSRDMVTIVVAGGIVLALSFGVRSVFGGVVEPLSNDLFGGRIEVISLSIAIQNLVWGLAQPAFGILADKFGDRRALWLGFAFYVVGMAICITGTTPLAQHLGTGALVGMGISGTAFGIVLAVVGRAAPPEKRTHYLGITSAIGSAGQVAMPLLASFLTEWLDWRTTLVVIAAMLAPMALCIPLLRAGGETAKPAEPAASISITRTVKDAFGHNSYTMLAAGFFVCGFHLAFITAHLPNYRASTSACRTASSTELLRAFGLQALALVGLANIAGTLLASASGQPLSETLCAGVDLCPEIPGDPGVHHAADHPGLGDDLCLRHGGVVAVHGAADQRAGPGDVRPARHGHLVRLRLLKSPGRQLRGRLARRRHF